MEIPQRWSQVLRNEDELAKERNITSRPSLFFDSGISFSSKFGSLEWEPFRPDDHFVDL
jgi:hypothetical protein